MKGSLSKNLALVLVGVVFAVLVGSGCGDGEADSGADSASAPLTKQEYIAKAENVCLQAGKAASGRFQALQKSNEDLNEAQLMPRASEEVLVPSMEEIADELQSLGPPAGDERQVDAFLTALQQAIDDASGRKITSFQQFSEPFQRYNKLIEAYGFENCTIS
jgi:hypothetical protein